MHKIPIIILFVVFSILLDFTFAFSEFFIIFVSNPVNVTTHITYPEFSNTEPLNNNYLLLKKYLFCPISKLPSN